MKCLLELISAFYFYCMFFSGCALYISRKYFEMDILELAFALILDLVNKYHASLKIKAHIFLGQIIYQLTIDRKILMLA